MKGCLTVIFLCFIFSSNSQLLLGGPKTATAEDICLTRIIEQGLMKLPQLTSLKPVPAFSTLQYQITSTIVYHVTYSATKYTAKIVGSCELGKAIATLTEASYTARK